MDLGISDSGLYYTCMWYYRIRFLIFTTNYCYSWFLLHKYLRLDLYLICFSIVFELLNFLLYNVA